MKGVIVPTTGDLRRIDTSVILGAVAGNASKKLKVLSEVTNEDIEKTKKLLESNLCEIRIAEGVDNLYIHIIMIKGKNTSEVIISESHTNITKIVKNGKTIFEADENTTKDEHKADRSNLNMDNIYEFLNEVDIDNIRELLDSQISYEQQIIN